MSDIERGWLGFVSKAIANTWYVAIQVPNRKKTGLYLRRSQSFASEAAAKHFAATKIEEGVEVSAGTLNPVLPKRIVGPSEIKQWLSEKPQKR